MVDAMKLWCCLATLSSAHTQPVNHIWRSLNHKSEVKTPTRTSNTDLRVIECADASFQVWTCFVVQHIMIINAVRWGLCSEAHRLLSSAPFIQNTFEGLRFACTLHVVLAKCSSPWGTFLLPIGKPSLGRRRDAQPSFAWAYRFVVVNAWRQTG